MLRLLFQPLLVCEDCATYPFYYFYDICFIYNPLVSALYAHDDASSCACGGATYSHYDARVLIYVYFYACAWIESAICYAN